MTGFLFGAVKRRDLGQSWGDSRLESQAAAIFLIVLLQLMLLNCRLNDLSSSKVKS